MDLEPDISRRLHEGAAAVSAHSDLGEVIAGARHRRQRTRWLSIGGAAAVVALGVGGVVLVANRDRTPPVDRASAAPTTVVSSPSEQPAAEPAATDVPAVTAVVDEDAPTSTVLLAPMPPQFDPSYATNSEAALDYLDRTAEVYQRAMPSGVDLSVRLSDVSYGELFDLGWDAPTGSAEQCLAGPAAFIGGSDNDGGAWIVQQWAAIDGVDSTSVEELSFGGRTSFVVIRTELPALEAMIGGGGLSEDRAEFVDGVAVLEISYRDEITDLIEEEGPTITVVADAGLSAAPQRFDFALYEYRPPLASLPADCRPPDQPPIALPPPGEQPADPAAAEAEVRARHALLVDRSIAPEDKPQGLLDDDAGVAEARAQMEAGQYAESAAGAVYTIEEVVFTAADTAWFRYSIDAPTGLFANRFGQSTFNGEVWQITRQTICQDLSLAAGYCDGDGYSTMNLLPISQAEIEASWNEWEQLNQLYWRALQCNPVNPC